MLVEAGVIQPDDRWNEGSVVAFNLAVWKPQSAAEGASQGSHCLMKGVRGVVHDGCQFG